MKLWRKKSRKFEWSLNNSNVWECNVFPTDEGLTVFAKNVTARKKAEDALADSVAKYRALVENADDAILLTDLRGKQITETPPTIRVWVLKKVTG